jgi:hypothetical protein
MPGYDGTGPRGLGRMTGRGLGYCASPADRQGFGLGLMGWRRGLGRGFGRTRGMGVGRGAYAMDPGVDRVATDARDELAELQEQAARIENQLQQIRARMDELS